MNQRKKNKHLKRIELGDKVLMIDAKMAEVENDKAEKQCQDNNHAFFEHKKKSLFPNKLHLSHVELAREKNKQIVNAYKLMSQCVKLKSLQASKKRTVQQRQ